MSKRVLKKTITAIMAAVLMVTGSVGVTNVTQTASAAKKTKSGDFKYVKYLNGIKITKYKVIVHCISYVRKNVTLHKIFVRKSVDM